MSVYTQDDGCSIGTGIEPSLSTIRQLFDELADHDGQRYEQAQRQLVTIGGPVAVRALVCQLGSSPREVRWEVVKAMSELADPMLAPVLAFLLRDSDRDIRWQAAKGVAQLGTRGLAATLREAQLQAGNSGFCDAAHYALVLFRKNGIATPGLNPVIHAAQGFSPGVELPVAAEAVLLQLGAQDCESEASLAESDSLSCC